MKQKMIIGILALTIIVAAIAFYVGLSVNTPLGEAIASKLKPSVCSGDIIKVCDKSMRKCFDVQVNPDLNAVTICGGGSSPIGNGTNTTAINPCATIMIEPTTGTMAAGCSGGGLGGGNNTTSVGPCNRLM